MIGRHFLHFQQVYCVFSAGAEKIRTRGEVFDLFVLVQRETRLSLLVLSYSKTPTHPVARVLMGLWVWVCARSEMLEPIP